MIIFIDTSAWVKFFIFEQGTVHIQKFMLEHALSGDNIFSGAAVTYAEMIATFRRAWKGHRIIREESVDRKVSPGYGFTAAPECKNCISAPPHLPASPGYPMQKYNFCTPGTILKPVGGKLFDLLKLSEL